VLERLNRSQLLSAHRVVHVEERLMDRAGVRTELAHFWHNGGLPVKAKQIVLGR
jgi:hypothetical protein